MNMMRNNIRSTVHRREQRHRRRHPSCSGWMQLYVTSYATLSQLPYWCFTYSNNIKKYIYVNAQRVGAEYQYLLVYYSKNHYYSTLQPVLCFYVSLVLVV